jgi:signal peptidase II
MVLTSMFLAAGLAVFLDQASKEIALTRVKERPRIPGRFGPRMRLIRNRTIALGLVRRRSALVLLWAIAVLGTILLILHAPLLQGHAAQLGLGLAMGGATSNLLDMLRRGGVVDFIDLRVWPVFNLADAFIFVGVGVAIFSMC